MRKYDLNNILTIFDHFWHSWQFWTILTIVDKFWPFDNLEKKLQVQQFWHLFSENGQFGFFHNFCNFENVCKKFSKFSKILKIAKPIFLTILRIVFLPVWQLQRQFWRLATFETLITILTIENLNSDNLCHLTIKSDTGQHPQFYWGFSHFCHHYHHNHHCNHHLINLPGCDNKKNKYRVQTHCHKSVPPADLNFSNKKVATPQYLFFHQFEELAPKKSLVWSQPLLQLAPALFLAVAHKPSQTTCQPLWQPGGYYVTYTSEP